MTFDATYYYTNVRVWARRYGIEISATRAEKALRVLEQMKAPESIAPMVAVLFCVLKDRQGYGGDDAIKLALIGGRALIETIRTNSQDTPTETYVSWVKNKAPNWASTVEHAIGYAGVIDAIVAKGVVARTDEYTRPNLMREIKKSINAQVRAG